MGQSAAISNVMKCLITSGLVPSIVTAIATMTHVSFWPIPDFSLIDSPGYRDDKNARTAGPSHKMLCK